MSQAIRIFLTAAALGIGALGVCGQIPPVAGLSKSTVIEKVVVEADKSQSYALYLPAAYDPSKQFPIIYCFDPGGRGRVAVEKFRAAGEKYGYIVVGSNNSRNGLDGKALSGILNTLWDETHHRFSIDDKRVLAAGLSGGARVASSVANSCGCMFGVIGSGAGFSNGIEINEKLPFIFFGTVGYDDFNYPELLDLGKKLAAAHITRRIEFFDGGHEWLDESLADEAIAWFELHGMKAGRRAKDDSLIETLFQARVARADAYLAAKKPYEAYSSYSGIVDDFAGWRDISKFAEKVKSLEASTNLKKAIKSEADELREQSRITDELLALCEKFHDTDEKPAARSQIHQEIETLTKKSAGLADSRERRVARRVLGQVSVQLSESATNSLERGGNYNIALDNLEIAAEINPKSAQLPYNRARIYALQGDKKQAIEALTKAIALGFKDHSRLTNEKAFETLQTDERFLKLLAGLKKT